MSSNSRSMLSILFILLISLCFHALYLSVRSHPNNISNNIFSDVKTSHNNCFLILDGVDVVDFLKIKDRIDLCKKNIIEIDSINNNFTYQNSKICIINDFVYEVSAGWRKKNHIIECNIGISKFNENYVFGSTSSLKF